ncbi:MAG TPA: hypothetical protein DDW52_09830 [Planctomycetaceae bacterium]|nr:hypothetical protein [Planctomycetaceae bacterium]
MHNRQKEPDAHPRLAFFTPRNSQRLELCKAGTVHGWSELPSERAFALRLPDRYDRLAQVEPLA